MDELPQITTLDEAKAALDEEIASIQSTVDYYTKRSDDAKRDLREHEGKLWALKRIRRRMDPPAKPTLVAAGSEAA